MTLQIAIDPKELLSKWTLRLNKISGTVSEQSNFQDRTVASLIIDFLTLEEDLFLR